MDSQLIKSLIEALAASDLAELEYSHDGETLRLTRRVGDGPKAVGSAPSAAVGDMPTRAETSPPPAPANAGSDIVSPLYGVVHLRPTPGAPPFVAPGQEVATGQTLCVIEAMKVFNEVRAERGGTIRAVLVESGHEVEIGQPLFRLD